MKIPVDPKVKIGKLPNGLTYYIRKNAEPQERAELNLVIRAGSLQESDDQQGLAHFTEHMAFNGTKSFPKNDLIDYLQRSGIRFGADLNAYTGFNETVYQLPIPTDDQDLFESGFQILSEWAGAISFEEEEIDNERGVVIAEERQRGKNVSERLSKQLMPVMLANSRYAERLPIGETGIIENFEHETLRNYYRNWYRPDLMAVIAVGDFDVEKVEELIQKNFSWLSPMSDSPERKEYEIPANEKPLVKIATDPEFPYTVASVIYKHPESVVKSEADFRNSIIRSAASSMFSSRFQELINSGKAPFLNAGIGYGPYQGGMVKKDAFTIQVVAKEPGRLKEAIEGAMDEVNKVKQYGFTSSELERVKSNFMASVEKSLKEREKVSSKAYLKQYINHFTSGEAIIGMEYSYDFYSKYLDGISLEEVNAAAASFVSRDDQIILVQAKDDSKDILPDEKTLIDWVNDTSREVSEYVDDVVNATLIDEDLKGGKQVDLKQYEAINTSEIKLSNGVKVILKPTDFKNDEILFTAFSPGGLSLAEEEMITTSKMADNIIGSSGVGDFSSTQLGKMLTGKSLGVSPFISTYSEGIKGFAAPDDVETALELIYLYFTNPRKDTAVYNRIIENSRIAIEGKSSNPMSVFQDTVNVAMKGYGPWAESTSVEQLKEVNLEDAFEFYTERFSDAGDFTFVFVGNFKKKELLPLLEKYLGSLPSSNTAEAYKDVGIQPLQGKVTKKVYRGLEDKAVVVLSLHDEYEYSKKNNLDLKVLKSALETRILKRLREKEKGVYSPSVGLSYVKTPSPYYSLAISFSCAPDQVDQLVQAAREEIETIRKKGPSAEEIEKFIATENRQREVALRTNRFWLNYLQNVYSQDKDIYSVLNFNDELENIKRKKVKKAGRSLLSTDGNLELYLFPEALKPETKVY